MRGRIADEPGTCKTPLSLHVTCVAPPFPAARHAIILCAHPYSLRNGAKR